MYTLNESPGVFSLGRVLDLSLLGLFVAGLVGCWRGSPAIRYLGMGSAAVVVFNGMLHTLWGVEYFLYSQHWHVSFLIPLAGLFFYSPRARPYWTLGIMAFVIFTIAKNWIAMDVIWSGLAG
jgi:FtsH-binding integral membrane protein